MYKRTYYNQIWFCNEYYIGGTDILSDCNRKFVKEININLSDYAKDFPYKYITGAKLYSVRVNRINFGVVIAEIAKNINIIAYLTYGNFARAVKANNDISRQKNREMLLDFAVKQERKKPTGSDVSYIYADNNAVRYQIKNQKECIIVQKQTYFLNPDATIDIPCDLESDPYKYLGWYEYDDGVSVYRNIEELLKKYLFALSKEIFLFQLNYFAKSTLRVSRITLTLICPGYSSSLSILRAISLASNTVVSSLTSSGLTMIRISRPACTAYDF